MKATKRRHKSERVTVGNTTVLIYRRDRTTTTGGKRSIFEVCDYTGGARRMRSFSDIGTARKAADTICRQLSTGQATASRMLNSEAASYGRAIELLRPTGVSLELASAAYAKAFEILGADSLVEAAAFFVRHRSDQVTQKRVADVVAELIEAKTSRGKSARYIADLRARLGRFADSFAVDISSVTTADVQRWLDALKLAPQTARNFRTVLFTLFAFAESRGFVLKGSNPVASTERIQSNGGDIEIYTPAEITALLEGAPTEYLPIIALGAFAGLRAAETERLQWQNIDLAGGFIHVGDRTAKTRSRRLVPIPPNLAEWLAPYSKQRGLVWSGTPDDLRTARAKTTDASGVAWKPNALRHSFASYRLAEVQSAGQVALELGNSPDMVFRHYREIVTPATAKAWFAVSPGRAAKGESFAEAKGAA